MRTKPPDITTGYTNTQTGNTCPDCGKQWLDEKPTPGIIHRTRQCDDCLRRERALEQPEDLDE